MKVTFLYPASGISPHPVHLAWAKSVGARVVETPIGVGIFDQNKLQGSDILLLESLYCAPFARKYKKKNPNCKVISIIADTSFWSERLSIVRKVYYRRYLGIVDGFLADSKRISRDIKGFIKRPVAVVRPYATNRFEVKKRGFTKTLLFIGHEPDEKGYKYLVRAMKLLPDFELFLVGRCCKEVKTKKKNIRLEGRVPSLKKYFEKCSIYVHPADFEPFGVAPLEAMYAGLIPIISKDVGLGEMFDKKLAKLLVLKSNDPEEIAKKVREIYNLKNRAEIIQRCRTLAKSWTREKSLKLFKKSFSDVLSKTRR
jgi:glycosyltransferase involved in cell wall biosynthesis